MNTPKDRHGNKLIVGSPVRLLSLSCIWINELPEEEQTDVRSMIGETFEIVEIDEYGCAWIRKAWHGETDGSSRYQWISVKAEEVEIVRSRVE